MASRGTLGLVGYGRFGQALAALADEAGFAVQAFDPHAEIPAARRVSSLARLAEACDTLLVAVPLEHTDSTLCELAPHLTDAHLVLDVGSVKTAPLQAMRELLPATTSWVATHPLFGPTSLARGERPLRVVLCEANGDGGRGGRALWETLGCVCLEQTAEEHDRAMARSHALAFFIAKGLVDVGAGEGAAFSPPSFDAIRQTIQAVRSDAGHLFRSIQNRNPFAAEERARLLRALQSIDRGLAFDEDPEPASLAPTEGLAAPAAEEDSPEELVAELDREIFALVQQRARIAARARLAHPTFRGESEDAESVMVAEALRRMFESL